MRVELEMAAVCLLYVLQERGERTARGVIVGNDNMVLAIRQSVQRSRS